MNVFEKTIEVEMPTSRHGALKKIREQIEKHLSPDSHILRIIVVGMRGNKAICEALTTEGNLKWKVDSSANLNFRKRSVVNEGKFNVVLTMPTGVGAEIGGHAGDGGPAAKLLGQVCDTLILHPNVVNGSDLNDQPANSLYVEGSVLSRFLMGTVGLRPTRINRVLLVVEESKETVLTNASINMFNATRAVCGYDDGSILILKESFDMGAHFSELSGRATGKLSNLGPLLDHLHDIRDTYDAIAFSTNIQYGAKVDDVLDYFRHPDGAVNPIGSVEALLTHTVSTFLGVQSAHSPQIISAKYLGYEFAGLVEPTVAAEAPSISFLYCVLKGMYQSPKIVTNQMEFSDPSVMTAEQVSCLVQPDRCIGLPTLAALEQGIPVIAVADKVNVMKNDLESLPWDKGQLIRASSYFEAAGILASMRGGINLNSLRRPLPKSEMSTFPKE